MSDALATLHQSFGSITRFKISDSIYQKRGNGLDDFLLDFSTNTVHVFEAFDVTPSRKCLNCKTLMSSFDQRRVLHLIGIHLY